jgi:hypothetical protein
MNIKLIAGLAAVGYLVTRKPTARRVPAHDDQYNPPPENIVDNNGVVMPEADPNTEVLQQNLNTFYRRIQGAGGGRAFNKGPIVAGPANAPINSERNPQATAPRGMTFYGSSTYCPGGGLLDTDGKFGRCTARAYWIAWSTISHVQGSDATLPMRDSEGLIGDIVREPETSVEFWQLMAVAIGSVHKALADAGLTEG